MYLRAAATRRLKNNNNKSDMSDTHDDECSNYIIKTMIILYYIMYVIDYIRDIIIK